MVAVLTVPFKPIVEALDDLEVAAGRLVLAASEVCAPIDAELRAAVVRLATALWELQETRARAQAIAAEVGTPPLHVVRF